MKVNTGKPMDLSVTNQGLAQQTQNLTGPEKFQQTMLGVTSALAGAAGAASPFFPGGAVVSAALSGVVNTERQAMNNGGVGAFGAGNSFGGGGGMGTSGGMIGMGGGGMPGMGGGGMGGGGGGGMPGMPGAGAGRHF